MTKYLWAALAVLGLALAGSLYALRSTTMELGEATLQVGELSEQLAASQARLGAIQKQVAAATIKRQQAEKELRDVLKQNKEWADAPVPPAVVDSLCKRARCSPAGARGVPEAAH